MSTKTCRRCGFEKVVTEFYTCKRARDGLLGECKTCHKEQMNAHRKSHPEYHKNWRATHRDYMREYAKRWRKDNPNYYITYYAINKET